MSIISYLYLFYFIQRIDDSVDEFHAVNHIRGSNVHSKLVTYDIIFDGFESTQLFSPNKIDIRKTCIVLICYNRPDYLNRTLTSLLAVYNSTLLLKPDLIISQDGSMDAVVQVIQIFKIAYSKIGVNYIHEMHEQYVRLRFLVLEFR